MTAIKSGLKSGWADLFGGQAQGDSGVVLPTERLADLEVKADEPARLTPRTLRAMPTKIFIRPTTRPEHVTEDLCARMKKGKAKDCSTSSSNPMLEGPWCRFRREARARERHQHMVDSLKALDPKRPIREADIAK